jgi:hypothetical protein
MANFPTA